MREEARTYDVRMAQFVLKIEKLSHIMGPRASQDLRSPSPIMAPGVSHSWTGDNYEFTVVSSSCISFPEQNIFVLSEKDSRQ